MKKLALMLVAALALVASGCCSSPAARQAAAEIEDSQKILLPEYRSYIDRDATLAADQKDRRRKLVESLERLVAKLRKALED